MGEERGGILFIKWGYDLAVRVRLERLALEVDGAEEAMVVDFAVGDGPDGIVGDVHRLSAVLGVVDLETGEAKGSPAVGTDVGLKIVRTAMLELVRGVDSKLDKLVAGEGAPENCEDSAHDCLLCGQGLDVGWGVGGDWKTGWVCGGGRKDGSVGGRGEEG